MDKFRPYDWAIMVEDWGEDVKKGDLVIIEGTYSDLYGGADKHSRSEYAVYPTKNGRVVNRVAWVAERQMKKVPGRCSLDAVKLTRAFNKRNSEE